MDLNVKRNLLVSSFLVAMASSSLVLAAGNGSTPNGKPFVEIQGQFVEVQEDINLNSMRIGDVEIKLDDVIDNKLPAIQADLDALGLRVDSVEGRVAANDLAIQALEAENVTLNAQITEVMETAAANSTDIAAAMDQIDILSGDLDVLSADVVSNADQIQTIQDQIATLQDFIVANATGLMSLTSRVNLNYSQINHLRNQISSLRAELARKQDTLDGSCPSGYALRAIAADGAISCEKDDTVAGLKRVGVSKYVYIPGKVRHTNTYRCGTTYYGAPRYCTSYYYTTTTKTVSATCPAGTVMSGGGFDRMTSAVEILSSTGAGETWTVSARNNSTSGHYVWAQAECIAVIK